MRSPRNISALFLFLSISIHQERIGEWDCFTSTLNISDIAILGEDIYCATDGGILQFSLSEKSFNTYTKLHGLNTTNLSVIESVRDEIIWIGGNEPGFIQRFDPSKEMVISEFPYEFSEISHVVLGDTVAYAVYRDNQYWGIAEYRSEDGTFYHRDLYPVWQLAEDGINDIEILDTTVFIGTQSGLFIGEVGENPNSWNLISEEIIGNVTDIEIFGDSLFFILDSEVCSMNLDSQEIEESGVFNFYLLESLSSGATWAINSSYTRLVEVGGEEIIILPAKAKCITSFRDSLIIVGMEEGLFIKDLFQSGYEVFVPNTLPTNQISALTILNDGRLIAGSKKGLSILEPWGWRNIIETTSNETLISDSYPRQYFSADTIPVDFGGYVADIEKDSHGNVYCAIRGPYPEPRHHGGGVVIIDIDNPGDFTLIDTTHLDYFLDEYMVVKDMEFDNFGNLRITAFLKD